MPLKKGIVLSIDRDGWAEVVTDKLDACADCVTARNCPTSCRSTRVATRVFNKAGAKEGDMVSIYLSAGSVLQSAALLYLIPVFCLIMGASTGAGLSEQLALNESTSALIFGFAGLFIGFIFLVMLSRRLSTKNRLTPIITRIIISAKSPESSSAAIHNSCKTGACPG